MEKEKIAKQFAGEKVQSVEFERGTVYDDGGMDFKEYFETASGKHIVVEHRHTTGKTFARKSDGVVW